MSSSSSPKGSPTRRSPRASASATRPSSSTWASTVRKTRRREPDRRRPTRNQTGDRGDLMTSPLWSALPGQRRERSDAAERKFRDVLGEAVDGGRVAAEVRARSVATRHWSSRRGHCDWMLKHAAQHALIVGRQPKNVGDEIAEIRHPRADHLLDDEIERRRRIGHLVRHQLMDPRVAAVRRRRAAGRRGCRRAASASGDPPCPGLAAPRRWSRASCRSPSQHLAVEARACRRSDS